MVLTSCLGTQAKPYFQASDHVVPHIKFISWVSKLLLGKTDEDECSLVC